MHDVNVHLLLFKSENSSLLFDAAEQNIFEIIKGRTDPMIDFLHADYACMKINK